MKVKARGSETVSDIQTESQGVLDSFEENNFRGSFECGKDDGVAVCFAKENVLNEMAPRTE
jgi:hypothetical protein